MRIAVLFKAVFMTKHKYYKFVENTHLESDNDIASFVYQSDIPHQNILQYMFYVQPFHKEINDKYRLDSIAGEGGDLSRALRIQNWLTDNTCYNGMQWRMVSDNPVDILCRSYKKGFKDGMNCRAKAYCLTDCLLAVGIKALPLCLMRSIIYNGQPAVGAHFMVHIYISEIKKWIVTDPSFNTYFTDASDELLDYFQLIKAVKNKSYTPKGYNFNGSSRGNDKYGEIFVEGTMQHIAIWKNNIRTKNPKRVKESYYIISPQNYLHNKINGQISFEHRVSADELISSPPTTLNTNNI